MITGALSYLLSLFSPIDELKPIFRLNGVELDLSNKTITLFEPFNIHCTENLMLSSNKHVLLQSGQGTEHDRPDYLYSVWVNSPLDEQGRPLKTEEPKYHIPYSKRPRTIRLKGRKYCACH